MSGFRFALGEAVRIAKTGDLATVLKQHRTEYDDFYTIRRAYDGAQFELPETALRSSAVGTNVIHFPLSPSTAVQ
jgi:hypothetical protein